MVARPLVSISVYDKKEPLYFNGLDFAVLNVSGNHLLEVFGSWSSIKGVNGLVISSNDNSVVSFPKVVAKIVSLNSSNSGLLAILVYPYC